MRVRFPSESPNNNNKGTTMSFFKKLAELNATRQKEWDPDSKFDILFRALEHVSEAGELGNKIKKYWRATQVDVGSKTNLKEIEDEVGDVIVTLSLLCSDLGIDIEQSTINKFNATSEKYSLDTKWDTDPSLDFQARVRLEQKELQEKLVALNGFLNKGRPCQITQEAWDLLQIQANFMRGYNYTLQSRIRMFDQ